MYNFFVFVVSAESNLARLCEKNSHMNCVSKVWNYGYTSEVCKVLTCIWSIS